MMSELNMGRSTASGGGGRTSLDMLAMLRFGGSNGTEGGRGIHGSNSVRKSSSGNGEGFADLLNDRLSETPTTTASSALAGSSGTDTRHRQMEAALQPRKLVERAGPATTLRRADADSVRQTDERIKKSNPKETEPSQPEKAGLQKTEDTDDTTEPREEKGEKSRLRVKMQGGMEDLLARMQELLAAMIAMASESSGTGAEMDAAEAEGLSATADTGILTGEGGQPETAKLLEALQELIGKMASDKVATTGEAEGPLSVFLQKLSALLGENGDAASALKGLVLKANTEDGGKLMLMLKTASEGIRGRIDLKSAAGLPETNDRDATSGAIAEESGVMAAESVQTSGLSGEILAGGDAQTSNGSLFKGDSTSADGSLEAVPLEGTMTQSASPVVVEAGTSGQTNAGTSAQANAGMQAMTAAQRETMTARMADPAQTRASAAAPLQDPEMTKSVTGQISAKLLSPDGEIRHEMELQLKPENLGKIQLKIVEERGQVLAKFTAESDQIRNIIESNLQQLKDALERNGLAVQGMSVSVGQRDGRNGETGEKTENGNGHMVPRGIRTGTEAASADASPLLRTHMAARTREYLYGSDSTIVLKA